jgi:hypothetical protein
LTLTLASVQVSQFCFHSAIPGIKFSSGTTITDRPASAGAKKHHRNARSHIGENMRATNSVDALAM